MFPFYSELCFKGLPRDTKSNDLESIPIHRVVCSSLAKRN